MNKERKESANIGGAWKKVSASGNNYISGQFNNGKHFAIFPNNKKVEGSNQPDYRLVMDEDDAVEMGIKYEPKIDQSRRTTVEDAVEEIPF